MYVQMDVNKGLEKSGFTLFWTFELVRPGYMRYKTWWRQYELSSRDFVVVVFHFVSLWPCLLRLFSGSFEA